MTSSYSGYCRADWVSSWKYLDRSVKIPGISYQRTLLFSVRAHMEPPYMEKKRVIASLLSSGVNKEQCCLQVLLSELGHLKGSNRVGTFRHVSRDPLNKL